MANIEKLAFPALDVHGKNYMRWTIDVKMHLIAMGIAKTIEEGNTCSEQERAKACVFLCKHIDDCLRDEYMNTDNPSVLWNGLKQRFDHQKDIIFPTAMNEWNNIRFQDFKKVNDYSSTLFKIVARLRFCGKNITEAEMLEKTYSTFHASNITLQQQYRMREYKTFSELNTALLVAEQNSELLMKNHQSRPTGSVAFPEANATTKIDHKNTTYSRRRGRGRGRGKFHSHYNLNHRYNLNHGYGRSYNSGRSNSRGRGRGRGYNNTPRDNKFQQLGKPQNHDVKTSTSHGPEDPCYRCGMTGHWSRNCRTAPHLCKLYQDSIKEKEKEVHFTDLPDDTTPELNVSDFLDDMC